MKVYSRNHIDKLHWKEKSDIKKTYQLLIRNQMRRGHRKEVLDHQYVEKIKITAHLKRTYDHDNLVGGCKQLIDALCNENWIWDDAPKYVGMIEVIQEKTTNDPYTAIERYFPD
jgi:adenylate kinase family enzyme